MQDAGGATGARWLRSATDVDMGFSWLISIPGPRGSPAAPALDARAPPRSRGRFLFLGFRLLLLHARAVAQRAQYLVAAGHDLVAFLQPAQHLDVRGARDARFHLHELGLLVRPHHEHALDLFLLLVSAL